MAVKNLRMREKINSGEAVDVSGLPRYGGAYILPVFTEGKDYCNGRTEQWIWSIGKRKSDGVILASHSDEFYQHAEFECLWLR
jgi:hypothetical protein